MNENYGQTIEKIRRQKNILIKDLIEGVMDSSTYHRFKNNDIDTTVSKFIIILQRLNVRFEEFLFIHENFKLDFLKSTLLKLQNYYNQKDIFNIKQLIIDIEIYDWDNKLTKRHMVDLVTLYLNVLQNKTNNLDSVSLIQYLKKVETWTHYEIAMFSNCIRLLPVDLIDYSLHYVMRSFSVYKHTDIYYSESCRILINAITLFIGKKEIELAKKWYRVLRQQELNDFLIFEAFYVKLLDEFLSVAESKVSTADNLEKFEDFLVWLNRKEYAQRISSMNKQIIKDYLNTAAN